MKISFDVIVLILLTYVLYDKEAMNFVWKGKKIN